MHCALLPVTPHRLFSSSTRLSVSCATRICAKFKLPYTNTSRCFIVRLLEERERDRKSSLFTFLLSFILTFISILLSSSIFFPLILSFFQRWQWKRFFLFLEVFRVSLPTWSFAFYFSAETLPRNSFAIRLFVKPGINVSMELFCLTKFEIRKKKVSLIN